MEIQTPPTLHAIGGLDARRVGLRLRKDRRIESKLLVGRPIVCHYATLVAKQLS